MKKLVLSFYLVLFSVVLFAQEGTVKEVVSVKGFNSIDVSSAFEIEVIKSPKRFVEVEISENLRKYLVAKESGDTFELYLKDVPSKEMKNDVVLKAVIKTPSLKDVELSGAVKAEFSGVFEENEFEMDLSGATHVSGMELKSVKGEVDCSGASNIYDSRLDIDYLEMDCSGASKLDLNVKFGTLNADFSGASNALFKGSGEVLKVDVSGAGKVDMEEVEVGHVSLNCSGASKLIVAPERSIDIVVSGASRLRYKKKDGLNIESMDISGAANVKSF